MTLRDIDLRPHPLGIVEHPEWAKVRDRHAERVCNWFARQAAEEAEQERQVARNRRQALLIDIASFAVLAGFVVLFTIALLRAGGAA